MLLFSLYLLFGVGELYYQSAQRLGGAECYSDQTERRATESG